MNPKVQAALLYIAEHHEPPQGMREIAEEYVEIGGEQIRFGDLTSDQLRQLAEEARGV